MTYFGVFQEYTTLGLACGNFAALTSPPALLRVHQSCDFFLGPGLHYSAES